MALAKLDTDLEASYPCDNGTLFNDDPVTGAHYHIKKESAAKAKESETCLPVRKPTALRGEGFRFTRPRGKVWPLVSE